MSRTIAFTLLAIWLLCGVIGGGYLLATARVVSRPDYLARPWEFRGLAFLASLLGPLVLAIVWLNPHTRQHGWRLR